MSRLQVVTSVSSVWRIISPRSRIVGAAVLLLGIALYFCASIYTYGISSILFLDSIHNLYSLTVQPLQRFSDILGFVFGNDSGPLGRPVSMYTFWLDHEGGELDGEGFRQTNILIHLL
ncbi:MAG: hypothetical protein MI746_14665, partial [Pseudomonadales bacterium]|nr:hypothetical protein [Pseudomonadales bacterium]